MPTPTPTLPQQWQDIAADYHRVALANSLAELRQIDYDIDYSFERQMRDIESGFIDGYGECAVRSKLYIRRSEILARLFGGLGK